MAFAIQAKNSKTKEQNQSDWFWPALNPQATLFDAFAEAGKVSRDRLELVKCLQNHFQPDPKQQDKFSALQGAMNSLTITLDYRLGLLRPEATESWFREFTQKPNFIFRDPIITLPIFKPFNVHKVTEYKELLRLSFAEGREPAKIPLDLKSSIWGEILQLRHQLCRLATLEGNFGKINLFRGEVELNSAVCESESLRIWVEKVQGRFIGLGDQLEVCFQKLWQASRPFWLLQQNTSLKKDSKPDPFRVYADDLRQKFKQRRLDAKWVHLTWHEKEALDLLGFASMPDSQSLRSRYLELVKKHHPDRSREEGNEFKKIVLSYELLKERIESAQI